MVEIRLNLEKIGRETLLVSKEAEFFIDQHIQNPLKSFSRNLSYGRLNILHYSYHSKCIKVVHCSRNHKLLIPISFSTKGFSAHDTNQTKEQSLLFLYICNDKQ